MGARTRYTKRRVLNRKRRTGKRYAMSMSGKKLYPKNTVVLRRQAAVTAPHATARQRGNPLIPITRSMSLPYRSSNRFITLAALNNPIFYRWSCNNMYDPDIGGVIFSGGHQPWLYDQVSAQYKAEKCNSSALECQFINKSGKNIYVAITVGPKDDPIITDSALLMDKTRAVTALIKGGGIDKLVNTKTLFASFNFRRARGKDRGSYLAGKSDLGTSTLTGWNQTQTSVPEEWVYTCYAWYPSWEIAPFGTDLVLPMNVNLKYNAKFAQPKDLGTS